jgi:hypothetical protein
MIMPIQLWECTKYLYAAADQQSDKNYIYKVRKTYPEREVMKNQAKSLLFASYHYLRHKI